MDKNALIVGYEKLEKENKRLQRDHDALLADIGRVSLIRQELERTVAKLPKCWRFNTDKTALVQTCPVVPGMVVWWAIKGSLWQGGVLGMFGNYLLALAEDGLKWSKQSTLLYSDCYDSLAAAEFAKQAEDRNRMMSDKATHFWFYRVPGRYPEHWDKLIELSVLRPKYDDNERHVRSLIRIALGVNRLPAGTQVWPASNADVTRKLMKASCLLHHDAQSERR